MIRRTEEEMMQMLLSFAEREERIRFVGMNGSRVNRHVPKDRFQDYDIVYIVTDIEYFKKSDAWLTRFGQRIMMQKPEAMKLFPPTLGNWFTYLMLFEDGNRIDLALVPIDEIDLYLASDTLLSILIDKDHRVQTPPISSDHAYHVKKPTADYFEDCCNEFWWTSTYVAKGLWRKEFLYAAEHMNLCVRPNLLTMLSWKVGIETDFSCSVGKSYKYLEGYVSGDVWSRLLKTYQGSSCREIWDALCLCHVLFRESSSYVANMCRFIYPDYDEKVTKYLHNFCREDDLSQIERLNL